MGKLREWTDNKRKDGTKRSGMEQFSFDFLSLIGGGPAIIETVEDVHGKLDSLLRQVNPVGYARADQMWDLVKPGASQKQRDEYVKAHLSAERSRQMAKQSQNGGSRTQIDVINIPYTNQRGGRPYNKKAKTTIGTATLAREELYAKTGSRVKAQATQLPLGVLKSPKQGKVPSRLEVVENKPIPKYALTTSLVNNPVTSENNNALVPLNFTYAAYQWTHAELTAIIKKLLMKVRLKLDGAMAYTEAQFEEAVVDMIEFYSGYCSAKAILAIRESSIEGNPGLVSAIETIFTEFNSTNVVNTASQLKSYGSHLRGNGVLPKSLRNFIKWYFGTVFKVTEATDAIPHINVAQCEEDVHGSGAPMAMLADLYTKILSNSVIYADIMKVVKGKMDVNFGFIHRFDPLELDTRLNIHQAMYPVDEIRIYSDFDVIKKEEKQMLSLWKPGNSNAPLVFGGFKGAYVKNDGTIGTIGSLNNTSCTTVVQYLALVHTVMQFIAAGHRNVQCQIDQSEATGYSFSGVLEAYGYDVIPTETIEEAQLLTLERLFDV